MNDVNLNAPDNSGARLNFVNYLDVSKDSKRGHRFDSIAKPSWSDRSHSSMNSRIILYLLYCSTIVILYSTSIVLCCYCSSMSLSLGPPLFVRYRMLV
jgi:hypothetical protein